MTDQVLIKIAHIRAAELCTGGARHWFARHGLSWTDFLENGVPVEVIESTEDPFAMKVAGIAREDMVNGR